jgi:hypothetical protein
MQKNPSLLMNKLKDAWQRLPLLDLSKRKTSYNRNDTNGKYGIWGHDIEDLMLAQIEIYETTDQKLILALFCLKSGVA